MMAVPQSSLAKELRLDKIFYKKLRYLCSYLVSFTVFFIITPALKPLSS